MISRLAKRSLLARHEISTGRYLSLRVYYDGEFLIVARERKWSRRVAAEKFRAGSSKKRSLSGAATTFCREQKREREMKENIVWMRQGSKVSRFAGVWDFRGEREGVLIFRGDLLRW